jgi:vacuolar-type H+-ATPase subunit E/Vma4
MSGKVPVTDQVAALDPVRRSLLDAARADAGAVVAAAERESAALLDAARADAEAVLAEARRQGAADAARTRNSLLRRARHHGRALELAVRSEAYEELRRRIAARVTALRHGPDYPALHARLVLRAGQLLGPEAEMTEPPSGGVLAETRGRRVDLSLDTLAAHALDLLGAEAEQLWAP